MKKVREVSGYWVSGIWKFLKWWKCHVSWQGCTFIKLTKLLINTKICAFSTIDEPIMTHHNHPKFIRVHSCRFYGFGQMYNYMHPSLKYIKIQSIFYCSKNFLVPCSHLYSKSLTTTNPFTISMAVPFFFFFLR